MWLLGKCVDAISIDTQTGKVSLVMIQSPSHVETRIVKEVSITTVMNVGDGTRQYTVNKTI